MTAPNPGQFTLHARAVPPLKAGDYTLTGTQTIAGGSAAPYDGHVRVDAPRFTMPPDQLLSTFPPANAQGSFENRLPQVVLKRRTLPWDRRPAPDAPDAMPWLAVVVLAEGEAQLSAETPVAECVTPGTTLAGPGDVLTSVHLAVSRSVVDTVFPTKEDVALLAHVRQVDPSDTELSLGDDDGFLAVVMANRLPQYHRSTGPDDPDHPVRYLACLINLEGQLHVLPEPVEPLKTFDATAFVLDLAALSVQLDADHYVMGGDAKAPAGGPPVTAPARAPGVSTTSRTASAAAWQTAPARVARVAVSASAAEAGRLVRDTMGLGWRYPVDQLVLDPVYRFPVLAHWSFTVTGEGSFESVMQALDVGMLGTTPAAPKPPPPGAPPPPPPTRPAAELTDTGHVGLAHVTRRGDATRAWYRGPLTTRPGGADPQDPTVRLPLAHAGDQLRRVTPDGREDLSLAAAFEIGRLLALSQPSVVAAQLRWRREQFGASRAHRFVSAVTQNLTRFGVTVAATDRAHDLGRLVSRQVVTAAGSDPAVVLAPSRPPADPGRPLPVDGDVADLVAAGFGISPDAVRGIAQQIGVLAALRQTPVPGDDAEQPAPFDESAAAALRARLAETVQRTASDVLSEEPAGPGVPDQPGDGPATPVARPPDALDAVLASAARDRLDRDEAP